jgi:hypothetical protein
MKAISRFFSSIRASFREKLIDKLDEAEETKIEELEKELHWLQASRYLRGIGGASTFLIASRSN